MGRVVDAGAVNKKMKTNSFGLMRSTFKKSIAYATSRKVETRGRALDLSREVHFIRWLSTAFITNRFS